ncbi:MAG: NAD(P)H-dependent oxidoreductase [Candidatus Gastranaerophilales bacterium]|nr:NAD(P)H-dependent oxidoreductase [Candidatus Gastranaerophilales bacterium]
MNILMINGSPKGGASNTYKLTRAFLEGMEETVSQSEAVSVKEIQVNSLKIRPCLGCFSCWNQTPGQCCIQDDMAGVIAKLLWADVTIWSFPLYYYTVPGGLKNLIDRQLPMMLPFMEEREDGVGNGSHPFRYDIAGKRTVLISTCGFYTAEGNYDGVRSLFDHICGKDNGYTAIFCGQGELFRVPELSARTGAYLGYVRAAGSEYAAGGISEETRAYLDEMLYPKETFESWADASWGVDRESGEKESDALIFTRQMAALYRKESYAGQDKVLEMYYTDLNEGYQIVLGKEGSRVLPDCSLTATTRIETPITVWKSIAAGDIRGDEALMKQLYRVVGDFDLMLRWEEYFGDTADKKAGSYKGTENENRTEGAKEAPDRVHVPKKATNMVAMLIPWTVFWIFVAINGWVGAFVSIASCVLTPLLFYRHKRTLYDILSGALVAGFSIAVLSGISDRILLPLSYLTFGIMWCVSCLGRIPLTAHYSMNGYNGENALSNPLFMKTNRILTFLWGVLYLLTAALTYVLMGTPVKAYVGAVNSVVPILMGIFTAWFQKWYPARVARGERWF